MFAMTSGTTNRPKTIPVTDQSLRDYRDGWTIWGIQAFDAHPHMLHCGMMPILQLASDWRESFTPGGIPCGAITGLTAQMQSPLVRVTYCMPASASKIKDVESKYYLALEPLGLSRPRRHHRGQPQHHFGYRPPGRPREGHPDPRRRMTARSTPNGKFPDEVRQAVRIRSRWKRKGTARRLEKIVEADRPAPPQRLLAQPPVSGQLDRRDDGGLPPGLPRVLRRPTRSATSA